MIEFSLDELGRLRQHRQLLTGPRAANGAEPVVRHLVGLQAQDLRAATLGIRARSSSLDASDVETARVKERSIVRTWAMRGTLHLVAAEDLAWVRQLLAPRLIATTARRSAELGLDKATYGRAFEVMAGILQDGAPRTRSDLATELKRSGIDPSGQRMPYLLLRASVEGLVCEGPLHSGKPAYVLQAQWLKDAPPGRFNPDRAMGDLVHRYLGAYGPASPEDFSQWAGLTPSAGRKAFDATQSLTPVSCEGRTLWEDGGSLDVPTEAHLRALLLPAFDAWLLAYKDRSFLLDPRYARRVNAGGGMVRPVLVIDCRVEGTWRLLHDKTRSVLEVAPFGRLSPHEIADIEAEAAEIGRFLGLRPEISILRAA